MRMNPVVGWIYGTVLAYLAVLLVMAGFFAHPSALGWIGFGVASAIALALASAGAVLYERSRAAGVRLHPHPDGRPRLLVVADRHCDHTQLCAAVRERLDGGHAEVLVVAPVLAPFLHFLTNTEEREQEDARARLDEALAMLARVGVHAHGMISADDPLQAIGDALGTFRATEILLVPGAETRAQWLEDELVTRARDAFGVHVTVVAEREREAVAG